MIAEFRRANAAARRYEDLRYRSGRAGGVPTEDIPRRVFEEFYSVAEPAESVSPGRRRSDAPEAPGRAAKVAAAAHIRPASL
jgi:hypothetical protein